MQFSEPRNKLTQRCFEHGFCFGTGQISIFTKIQWHTFEDWLLGKQPQVTMLYQYCSNMCLHAVVRLSCFMDRFLWSSFRPSSTICFLTPPILAQSVSLQPISKLELTAPYFLRLVTLTVTDPFRPIGQWDIERYTLDWDPGMLLMHLWLTFGTFHLHTSFMLWTWRKAMFGSQMSGHVNSTVAHRQMIEELFAQVVTWWWHQESKSSNQSSYRRRSAVVDILGNFLSTWFFYSLDSGFAFEFVLDLNGIPDFMDLQNHVGFNCFKLISSIRITTSGPRCRIFDAAWSTPQCRWGQRKVWTWGNSTKIVGKLRFFLVSDVLDHVFVLKKYFE